MQVPSLQVLRRQAQERSGRVPSPTEIDSLATLHFEISSDNNGKRITYWVAPQWRLTGKTLRKTKTLLKKGLFRVIIEEAICFYFYYWENETYQHCNTSAAKHSNQAHTDLFFSDTTIPVWITKNQDILLQLYNWPTFDNRALRPCPNSCLRNFSPTGNTCFDWYSKRRFRRRMFTVDLGTAGEPQSLLA